MSYSLGEVKSSKFGCPHLEKHRIRFQLGFDYAIRIQCGICGADITEQIPEEGIWVSEGRTDEI